MIDGERGAIAAFALAVLGVLSVLTGPGFIWWSRSGTQLVWTETRCSQVCPTDAIKLVMAEESEIEALVAAEGLERYRDSLGTRPRVWYKNLHRWDKAFVGCTVVFGDTDECGAGASVIVLRDGAAVGEGKADIFGEVVVDFAAYSLERAGVRHGLSRREMDLLRYFLASEGRTLERSTILDDVWGREEDPTPRTADGKPDLSGNWGGAGMNWRYGNRRCGPTQVECSRAINQTADFEFEAPSRFGPARPLYKPQHWDKVIELDMWTNKEDPVMTCQPLGLPRQGPPRRIMQTENDIVFLYGQFPDAGGGYPEFRVVPTDGRQHGADAQYAATYFGDTVGRWDGDTLVVTTAGFNDRTWLDFAGHPHSEALRVTERFRRREIAFIDLDRRGLGHQLPLGREQRLFFDMQGGGDVVDVLIQLADRQVPQEPADNSADACRDEETSRDLADEYGHRSPTPFTRNSMRRLCWRPARVCATDSGREAP